MVSSEAKRLEALDALRGLAAIGVAIFWHYQHFKPESYPYETWAYWFYHHGYLGVNFFFVLSGFVFSYVYGEKIISRTIGIKRFIVLRLSRLYPVFLITTGVVAILQWARKSMGYEYFVYPNNDIYHLLLNFFFLQAGWFEKGLSFNAPSWSIAMECIAYLVFFGTLYYFPKHRFLIYYLLILLGLSMQKTQASLPFFNQGTSQVLIAFFIGAFTYKINDYLNKGNKYFLYIIISISFFLSVAASLLGHEFFGETFIDVYVILLFPSLILAVLNFKMLKKLTSLRPFTYLGDISYSIYLWHFPVQLILISLYELGCIPFSASSHKWFLMYFALVFMAGSISYRFETKIRQRIRNRFNFVERT